MKAEAIGAPSVGAVPRTIPARKLVISHSHKVRVVAGEAFGEILEFRHARRDHRA
jgi:hypothetical protein